MNLIETQRWGWLILFASSGTLVCCALPIVLVALGLGAVSASLFASLPFLATLALNKTWLFGATGLLLALSGWALYRPGRTCPNEPALAAQCETAHRWNSRLYWVSVAIWGIGFIAAYLSVPILRQIEV